MTEQIRQKRKRDETVPFVGDMIEGQLAMSDWTPTSTSSYGHA